MRKIKYIYIIFLLLTFVSVLSAQNDDRGPLPDINYSPIQNFPAPNVATFNTYGNIPVDLYTGTPDISIPIYTIEEDGFLIPITLRYNIQNVKPNTHPGVVGLGWNLMVGGNITRIQQGEPDDFSTQYNKYGYLGQECRLSDNWGSCYPYSSEDPNTLKASWYSLTRAHLDAVKNESDFNPIDPKYDMTPDKFTFNFLDYSGTFYRDHTGKWVVDSETPFKVEHTIAYLSSTRPQISNVIRKVQSFYFPFATTLIRFALTAPDGVVYYFGGEYAVDYSVGYFNQGARNNPPIATTWHLERIVLPNGKTFRFDYRQIDPIIDINYNFFVLSSYIRSYGKPFARGLNVQLIMPVALKSISTPTDNDIVTFDYSESQELEYPKSYFCYRAPGSPVIPCDEDAVSLDSPGDMGDPESFNYRFHYITSREDLKWNKLDLIVVNKPEIIKYQFEYTKSKSERLKLLSLLKLSETLSSQERHQFSYNRNKLPEYISGHYDHLGFYNGQDFSYTLQNGYFYYPSNFSERVKKIYDNSVKFFKSREGDNTGRYVLSEMLEQIVYPTGGHSVFSYEPHKVHQVVTSDRSSTYDYYDDDPPYFPGGLRIKSIENFDGTGARTELKRYYYVKNFNPSTKTGIPTSGILGFNPKYYWSLFQLKRGSSSNNYEELHIFNSGSTSLNYYNMNGGSYVGYSEVIETRENGLGEFDGYTKYRYSNFEKGFFDSKPILNIGYNPNSYPTTPHTPFTSNAKKRGKLLYKEIYDKNNKLKEGKYYDYLTNHKGQIRNLDIRVVGEIGGSTSRYILGGSYYINIFDYQKGRIITKTVVNADTIKVIDEYKYNDEGNLVLEKKTFNNNESLETKRRYSGDLFRESGNDWKSNTYTFMANNNILNSLIETVVLKNGKVISSQIQDYELSSSVKNMVSYPSRIYKLKTEIPLSDYHYTKLPEQLGKPLVVDSRCILELESKAFNGYGKINYIKSDGENIFYLWSYNGRYPIAEIKNTTKDDITNVLGNITPEVISKWATPDMSKIDILREKLPEAQVTTYKYKPLVGMTEKTDPRGVTTYYDYDSFGRLKETYIKENGQKRIIESYNYHYQNQ
jgi:YD repeat-containing protein